MNYGNCLCKAIRFEVDPPSRFCANCHCRNCRRAHGAAFVTWVGYPVEQFRLTAGEENLERYRTDTDATRSFCRICGTTLFYEGPRWENEIHIARAVINGAIEQGPKAHVYVDQKASWHEITDDLPRFGGETGMEPVT
jgi:hypothetical protein